MSHYLYLPIWQGRIPRTAHERRCRSLEALIGLWCDLDGIDDVPLQVIRDLLRPDLAVADIRMAVMEICDLSTERADHENDGPVEEWEALTDDYEAALGDLGGLPPNQKLEALLGVLYPGGSRPMVDAPLPENVHDIRGSDR